MSCCCAVWSPAEFGIITDICTWLHCKLLLYLSHSSCSGCSIITALYVTMVITGVAGIKQNWSLKDYNLNEMNHNLIDRHNLWSQHFTFRGEDASDLCGFSSITVSVWHTLTPHTSCPPSFSTDVASEMLTDLPVTWWNLGSRAHHTHRKKNRWYHWTDFWSHLRHAATVHECSHI